MTMVSLKDIAAACGVSASTVSKALNDLDDISEKRKAMIRQKANEMGYLPNMAARALKTKMTHNIGVLFIDDYHSGLTHPYFAPVLESLKTEVENLGYDITFINKNVGGREMSYLEHCRYRNVDGVVVANVDFTKEEVVELVESDIPVVTIDHVFNNCPAVVSDNIKGIRELTEYVISMGHKKIAYIHGQQNSVTKVRLASFYRTMEEHELSVPDEYVPEAPYLEAEASAEVTKKLLALKNPPTCILYPDDYTAIGGIAVIREAGLSIPSDISVAGYDGISLIQQFQPKLTTYAQDMSGIGKAAAQAIVDQIERPKSALVELIVKAGAVMPGASVRCLNENE